MLRLGSSYDMSTVLLHPPTRPPHPLVQFLLYTTTPRIAAAASRKDTAAVSQITAQVRGLGCVWAWGGLAEAETTGGRTRWPAGGQRCSLLHPLRLAATAAAPTAAVSAAASAAAASAASAAAAAAAAVATAAAAAAVLAVSRPPSHPPPRWPHPTPATHPPYCRACGWPA